VCNSYLLTEWEGCKMPALDAELDMKINALRRDGLLSVDQEGEMHSALSSRRKQLFDSIPVIKCKVLLVYRRCEPCTHHIFL
jgi:hypothetical protein